MMPMSESDGGGVDNGGSMDNRGGVMSSSLVYYCVETVKKIPLCYAILKEILIKRFKLLTSNFLFLQRKYLKVGDLKLKIL